MKKVLFFVLFVTLAFGQVRIQVTAPATLDQINISDLSVGNLKDLPFLFSLTITNFGDPVSVKMHFQIFAKVGNEPENVFVDVWSLPFRVERGGISFTNQDLAIGKMDIRSDMDRTKIYEDRIKRIRDLARSTGRLPAGRYRFLIQILDENETLIFDSWEKSYEVTNPSEINLVFPGYQSEVRTQFPVFKWIAPYLKDFEILVYEKLPNQTTPEEVVSGDKNLRWRYKTVETQVQYPQEALPLEDGKTYFWYVKSYIRGTRGVEEIRSEIWNFDVRLGTATQPSSKLSLEQRQILEKIARALIQSGNYSVANLLNSIVSDFAISIDGRDASPSEVEEIIQLLANKDKYEITIIEDK